MEAVVLDLDGTLLNSNKKVSDRNQKSIDLLMTSGIPVIIATARPPRAVQFLLPREIQSQAIMVYYNGAMIVSEQLGLNQHFSIDSKLSSELIDYLIEMEREHWLSIEVEDTWYSYKDLDYRSVMKVVSNPKKIGLSEIKQLNPTKILVSNLTSIEPLYTKFGKKANIIQTDSQQLLQIMRLNISKEYAVIEVSKILGISPENIMVFGDDFNDLGLFKLCGYPVAMGNAIDELKDLAKFIADTNDNDGVAQILEVVYGSNV